MAHPGAHVVPGDPALSLVRLLVDEAAEESGLPEQRVRHAERHRAMHVRGQNRRELLEPKPAEQDLPLVLLGPGLERRSLLQRLVALPALPLLGPARSNATSSTSGRALCGGS